MKPADPGHGEDRRGERVRRYRSRGVDVEIREAGDRVELNLDGHPIRIDYLDGKYSSQTANMFRDFDSVEEVVDELLANEGRTWILHGGPDDARHHAGGGHGGHGGHDHGAAGHDHDVEPEHEHDHGAGHEHDHDDGEGGHGGGHR